MLLVCDKQPSIGNSFFILGKNNADDDFLKNFHGESVQKIRNVHNLKPQTCLANNNLVWGVQMRNLFWGSTFSVLVGRVRCESCCAVKDCLKNYGLFLRFLEKECLIYNRLPMPCQRTIQVSLETLIVKMIADLSQMFSPHTFYDLFFPT